MHEMASEVAIGFQNPGTQLSGVATTVYEEIAFGPMNLGVARDEVLRRTESSIDALAIRPLSDRDPDRLSGGQQQLVAIAGLLALDPRHLILDEPTAQLDPAGTRLVADAIGRLAAGGASILIVEQKIDLLAADLPPGAGTRRGSRRARRSAESVLADPAVHALGVAEPSPVRIRRMAREAGIAPATIERALVGRVAGGCRCLTSPSRAWSTSIAEGGVRAVDGVDLRIGTGRAGRHRRPERERQVDAGSPPQRPAAADLGPSPRGRRRRRLANRRTARAAVGLVFQDPDRQIFAGSVRAEVEYGPRNLGLRGVELRAAVDQALAAVGLENEARTNPYDLGASRRKLLALASVLAMRTPVMVLDEPTTGQDELGVQRVTSVIDEAHADGRTVITISHDMRFVAEGFERVIVMRAGQIVLDGSPEQVFRRRVLG